MYFELYTFFFAISSMFCQYSMVEHSLLCLIFQLMARTGEIRNELSKKSSYAPKKSSYAPGSKGAQIKTLMDSLSNTLHKISDEDWSDGDFFDYLTTAQQLTQTFVTSRSSAHQYQQWMPPQPRCQVHAVLFH